MEVLQLGPAFAAELRGVDLIDVASSDAAYRTVRDAFEEHSVVVFRDQEIGDDVQVGFSRAFGPLERTKIGLQAAGSFYVRVSNIAPDGTTVPPDDRQSLINLANQHWHTDSSFKATPALASVLSVRIIPDNGGEQEHFWPQLHFAPPFKCSGCERRQATSAQKAYDRRRCRTWPISQPS